MPSEFNHAVYIRTVKHDCAHIPSVFTYHTDPGDEISPGQDQLQIHVVRGEGPLCHVS